MYTNEDEVRILIQHGLNHLKFHGKLPIVAEYMQSAQELKYFIARERCEFISRLLNNNVAATIVKTRADYDVTKLRSRYDRKRSASPVASKNSSRSSSSSSEHSPSSFLHKQKGPESTETQQEPSSKPKGKKASSAVCLLTSPSTTEKDGPTAKRSTRKKQGKSNDNESTSISNRSRTRSDGRVTAIPILCSTLTSSLNLESKTTNLKNKQPEHSQKRSHSSDKENEASTHASPT